jgi:hypothetical protein
LAVIGAPEADRRSARQVNSRVLARDRDVVVVAMGRGGQRAKPIEVTPTLDNLLELSGQADTPPRTTWKRQRWPAVDDRLPAPGGNPPGKWRPPTSPRAPSGRGAGS